MIFFSSLSKSLQRNDIQSQLTSQRDTSSSPQTEKTVVLFLQRFYNRLQHNVISNNMEVNHYVINIISNSVKFWSFRKAFLVHQCSISVEEWVPWRWYTLSQSFKPVHWNESVGHAPCQDSFYPSTFHIACQILLKLHVMMLLVFEYKSKRNIKKRKETEQFVKHEMFSLLHVFCSSIK